jgi:hypothetical protein
MISLWCRLFSTVVLFMILVRGQTTSTPSPGVSTTSVAGPVCISNSSAGVIGLSGIPATCNCVRLINDGAAQPVLSYVDPLSFNYTKVFPTEEVAVILYKSESCSGVLAVVICSEPQPEDSPAPTQSPSENNSSNSTSQTTCTRYARNNAVVIENLNPTVQCAYSADYGYAVIDSNLHVALFAQAGLTVIPVSLFTSSNCSEGSLLETVNVCFENSSAYVYNGSVTIPTSSPSPTEAPSSGTQVPLPTWGIPTKSPTSTPHKQTLFGNWNEATTWISISLFVGIPFLTTTLLIAVLFVKKRRNELKKVHTYENGQEEVSKGEEFSVQLSEVGEQVPLSVNDLRSQKE